MTERATPAILIAILLVALVAWIYHVSNQPTDREACDLYAETSAMLLAEDLTAAEYESRLVEVVAAAESPELQRWSMELLADFVGPNPGEAVGTIASILTWCRP